MSKKQKKTPSDTLVTKSEYWRLQAEIFSLRHWLGILWARSVGVDDFKSENFKKIQKDFDDAFKQTVSEHYSKLLYEIEEIAPGIAAKLDDRSPDEIQ